MKIVLVGDTQVGKSCLLARLITNKFNEQNPATIGAAFQNYLFQTSKGNVSLQIWDTAGQEKFRALAPMYYRSADIALLCFDLTNKESFEALEKWTIELAEKAPEKLKIIIVGNKCDLKDSRIISFEDLKEFAYSHCAAHFCETSSKNGEGVFELFHSIALMGEPEINSLPNVNNRIENISNTTSKSGCC